jgi:syntaxin 8
MTCLVTQLKEDMEMLDRNLRMMQGSPADFKVGSGEITRRQGLVHSLGLDIERFTAALEGRTVKKELMGDARPDKKAVETTETMGLDSRQLYDKHLDKKAAQDKAIDDILVGVTKVKQIGQDINDELTLHEQLLDDIDQGMDRVENRLKDNTKATKQIRQKDKSWFGFGLMILLFIVILVLIFI